MGLMQQWVEGKAKIDLCECDICAEQFTQRTCISEHRRNKKLANGRYLCVPCTKNENSKNRGLKGTEALLRISLSQRKINSSKAGIASANSYNPDINNSRFSKKRWDEKTVEDQQIQVRRANAGLQEKLKCPVYAAQHYTKIFAQTKIGYISKGHKALHALIEELGFESHVQIDKMQVDECNIALKIIVEYNGDMWHCNPRTWKMDEYNSAIRMTAGEKWAKDIARYSILRKLGYVILVIWESEWLIDAHKCINKIIETYNEISKQTINTQPNVLRFIGTAES